MLAGSRLSSCYLFTVPAPLPSGAPCCCSPDAGFHPTCFAPISLFVLQVLDDVQDCFPPISDSEAEAREWTFEIYSTCRCDVMGLFRAA